MATVLAAADSVLAFTGGERRFEAPAASVREMIRWLDARYPGLGAHIEGRMAIAIDGEIHQDALFEPLAPGAEVVLIPKIGGG